MNSTPASCWHVLNLGDPSLADEHLTQVLNAARAACSDNTAGNDPVVFQRHESEGRLHCELKLYFSPGLAAFGQSIGARACRAPDSYSLSRVVGCEQAAQRLFSQLRTG